MQLRSGAQAIPVVFICAVSVQCCFIYIFLAFKCSIFKYTINYDCNNWRVKNHKQKLNVFFFFPITHLNIRLGFKICREQKSPEKFHTSEIYIYFFNFENNFKIQEIKSTIPYIVPNLIISTNHYLFFFLPIMYLWSSINTKIHRPWCLSYNLQSNPFCVLYFIFLL